MCQFIILCRKNEEQKDIILLQLTFAPCDLTGMNPGSPIELLLKRDSAREKKVWLSHNRLSTNREGETESYRKNGTLLLCHVSTPSRLESTDTIQSP